MASLRYELFCEMAYGSDVERRSRILKELKEQKKFFLIVSPDTTPEDFGRKKFAIYVGPGLKMPVFLTLEAANKKALEINAVMDEKPMTVTSSYQALCALVEKYQKSHLIADLRFYERLPFYIDYSFSEWAGEPQKESADLEPQVDAKKIVPNSFPTLENPVGVEKLIKMLDCQDRSKIANYPTYSIFEKFPQLLQKLIQVNKCDIKKMDEILGLPSGVTEMIITTPTIDVSKDVLRRVLTYFGLQEYQYRYKDNCSELQRELKSNSNICSFRISPAKISTKERFLLEDIKRAKDVNGCWLYQLTFKSKARTYTCVVTSPLGMIVGKEYELEGLIPKPDEGEPSVVSVKPAVGKEEGNEIVEKMKAQYEKDQRDYLSIRKDYVIRYFKLHNPENRALQLHEAEKHYNRLAKDDDLLDEFFWKNCCPQKIREELEKNPEYQRRRENQPKDLRIKDYTADKLRKEFNIKPAWEVYFYLADLRKMPKKTMERLRYLNTDPQYQKN